MESAPGPMFGLFLEIIIISATFSMCGFQYKQALCQAVSIHKNGYQCKRKDVRKNEIRKDGIRKDETTMSAIQPISVNKPLVRFGASVMLDEFKKAKSQEELVKAFNQVADQLERATNNDARIRLENQYGNALREHVFQLSRTETQQFSEALAQSRYVMHPFVKWALNAKRYVGIH